MTDQEKYEKYKKLEDEYYEQYPEDKEILLLSMLFNQRDINEVNEILKNRDGRRIEINYKDDVLDSSYITYS